MYLKASRRELAKAHDATWDRDTLFVAETVACIAAINGEGSLKYLYCFVTLEIFWRVA